MSGPGPGDEELRSALIDAAEWVSTYLRDVGERPVLAQVEPGEIAAALPLHPPREAEPLPQILADVDRLLLPGVTHWNHPGFFAYFGITGSGAGAVGALMASALNVNGMLWRTSPAATELEQRTAAWVLELLGLPSGWFGQITDSASSSTFSALAAARDAAGLEIGERGMAGRGDLPRLRVYTSTEAHSSVEKACIALGIGRQGLCKIEVDHACRMRPDLLAAAIIDDLATGVRPIAVVASVGTTSTTSVDPVSDVADIAADHGLWLHVDAAYGGAAGLVEELRPLLDGCERADSLVVNPHKWMLVPIDCSLLYTARPDALRQAFSVVPFYLTTSEQGVVNMMDYGLVLGRSFRALKLWMVLRAYGADGLAEIIAGHVSLARWLADQIDGAHGWERLAPVPFSTVCFRRRPEGVNDEVELERVNAYLVERINSSGIAFVSHTRVHGSYAIRVAIGNAATEHAHVQRLWDELRRS